MNQAATPSELFTLQQAATFLGVHPGTIRRWANKQQLPGRQIGTRGDWRFTRDDLMKMVRMTGPEQITAEQNGPLRPGENGSLTPGAVQGKKARAKVKGSLEYAEALLETVREPLLVLNEELTVVSANHLFYTIFQIEKDEAEGKCIYEMGHSQWDIPRIRTLLEELLPQQHTCVNYEITHNFPGVGRKIMLLNARSVPQKQLILLAIEDITHATHIKQEAEVARKRLYDLFMHAPAFVAVLSGPNLLFEIANPPYRLLVGEERSLDGRPLLEAVPDIDPALLQIIQNVALKGERFIANELPVTLDWDSNAKPYTKFVNLIYEPLRDTEKNLNGLMCFGYEVTAQVEARKAAEYAALQLEQQTKTFAVTLAAVKDFIYTFDPSGRFTYASQPLLDLLQIQLAEIIGKNFHDLPYPEDVANTLQAYIAQVITTGESIVDETPFISPAGDLGYYEYIFVPVFDDEGKVATVAGSTRDITQRKLQERQKEDFMGIVSHELKTPVTSIKAFTQVLQRRFAQAGDEKAASLLGKMDTQINKLTSLIGDLLDVTKIEGGQLQLNNAWFAFHELVEEVMEELQRTTTRHHITCPKKLHMMVYGDRERLGQVITNFLTNAIKYSPQAEQILVSVSSDQQSVSLSVQDFGMGIPQEKQEHVFERFYRVSGKAHDTVPGIGLGLYISARIIERQGGRIWVESEEGKGSHFSFTVPIIQKTEPAESMNDIPEEVIHE